MIAATILELMGYEDESDDWHLGRWAKDDSAWCSITALDLYDRHAFAAEVKEFMRKKGFYRREWADSQLGNVAFYNRPFIIAGQGWYSIQDEYPRAVCEAAIKALKT